MPQKIEAVITCLNYADMLRYTLPQAINFIDRVVVVTHASDKDTKRICDHFGVDCIIATDDVFFNGVHNEPDKFNKGRAINLGLAHLRHDGWLIHMDADIFLPNHFRDKLIKARLHRDNIYGVDRLNTKSYENWMKHRDRSYPQHQWRFLTQANPHFPLGSRLIHSEFGYCCIGYFQMWHSSQRKNYPIRQGSAEHSDVLFSIQWPRSHRILLPELFVYHLESEEAPMGTNWGGRKTKRFGPPLYKPHTQHYCGEKE